MSPMLLPGLVVLMPLLGLCHVPHVPDAASMPCRIVHVHDTASRAACCILCLTFITSRAMCLDVHVLDTLPGLNIVLLMPQTLLPGLKICLCLLVMILSELSVGVFVPDSAFMSLTQVSCYDTTFRVMCCIVNDPDAASRTVCL